MSVPLEASIVRIFATEGGVVGTGFLVGETTVLTCAHVITTALGITHDAPTAPEMSISLDFPLIATGYKLTAQVIFWQSVQADGGGDIAVLHLKNPLPEGTRIARLVTADDLWDHIFRAFGFPRSHDQGVWASGKLRAREATGWVQIEDVKITGTRVQQGFSGSAVWDEQLDGVVGMVVAADEDTSKIAYIIPSTVLVKAYPALGQQAIPPCPYRGLLAFREQDAPFFFGREAFIEQLITAVQEKQFVAVIGSSGSGKSSVVFAGLLPRLSHRERWSITTLRPGSAPLHNLAYTLIALLDQGLSEIDRLSESNKLIRRLISDEISVSDVINRIVQKQQEVQFLLFVDQFEELYTLCQDGGERSHFLNALLSLFRSSAFKVIITLRADFLGYALSNRPFADALQYHDLKIGPMTRQELRRAIEEPAKKLSVTLEDGLTDRILDAVELEPGNLPLVEFTLTRLWAAQKYGKLTHQAYDAIGGVEQALADYAEDFYTRLSEDEQMRIRQIFIQLVRPGEGTADTRRLATRDEIGETNWTLVTRLSDARLVVSGRDTITDIETVEVVHEALIREWKRLAGWMEDNREFRLWQERLRSSVHQWEASGHSGDALLRGVLLDEAKEWILEHPQDLGAAEREFLRASISPEWERLATLRETNALTFRFVILKLRGCLLWFLAVLELPLFARFVLQFLGADSSSIFTEVLYAITGVILYPFHSILKPTNLDGHQAEWSTLVGIVVYWLLFLLIVNFLQWLVSPPEENEPWYRRITKLLAIPSRRGALSMEEIREEQEGISKQEQERIREAQSRMDSIGQALTLLVTVEKEEDAFEELPSQYVYPDRTDEQAQTWEHEEVPKPWIDTLSHTIIEESQFDSSSSAIIYLLPEETLVDICTRLALLQQEQITFFCPSHMRLQDQVSWDFLHKQAEKQGKEVSVICSNHKIRAMAKRANFDVAPNFIGK